MSGINAMEIGGVCSGAIENHPFVPPKIDHFLFWVFLFFLPFFRFSDVFVSVSVPVFRYPITLRYGYRI